MSRFFGKRFTLWAMMGTLMVGSAHAENGDSYPAEHEIAWEFDHKGKIIFVEDLSPSTLRRRNIINDLGEWIAGDAHVVVEDPVSGPDWKEKLALPVDLRKKAAEKGGYVHVVIGERTLETATNPSYFYSGEPPQLLPGITQDNIHRLFKLYRTSNSIVRIGDQIITPDWALNALGRGMDVRKFNVDVRYEMRRLHGVMALEQNESGAAMPQLIPNIQWSLPPDHDLGETEKAAARLKSALKAQHIAVFPSAIHLPSAPPAALKPPGNQNADADSNLLEPQWSPKGVAILWPSGRARVVPMAVTQEWRPPLLTPRQTKCAVGFAAAAVAITAVVAIPTVLMKWHEKPGSLERSNTRPQPTLADYERKTFQTACLEAGGIPHEGACFCPSTGKFLKDPYWEKCP